MNTRHYNAGEVIFHEGEISHEAFFLVSGTVEISIKSGDGVVVLGRLGPGEIFGEMGMITDRPRSATATAMENTAVECIDEGEFEHAILARPDRLRAYLSTLFDRIRTTDLLLQMEWRKSHALEARKEQTALRGLPPRRAAEPALKHRIRIRSATDNPGQLDLEVPSLPFRIGRAYADTNVALFARNDLSLSDSQPYQVSRNHCEIDYGEQGLLVRDRGSRLGTVVNNVAVGAHAAGLSSPLHEGENHLLLGTDESLFRFVIDVEKI